jgi:hypothetical protein
MTFGASTSPSTTSYTALVLYHARVATAITLAAKLIGSMIADNSSDLKAQSVHEVTSYLGKKTFQSRD